MNVRVDSTEELEKWMQRIEIGRLWKPDKTSLPAQQMATLSQLFMDHAMHSKDYRFLNTALKLNDRLRDEEMDEAVLARIEEQERKCLTTLEERLGLTR